MPYVLGINLGGSSTTAGLSRRHRTGWSDIEPVPATPTSLYLAPDGTVRGGPGEPRVHGFLDRVGDEVPMLVDGWRLQPPDLVAELVGSVVDRVATREQGPPQRLVLVVPGGWGPYRRDLLDDALWAAGLDEVTLLPEPVAAAEAHASTQPVPPGAVLAVYAHGATSVACSVVRRTRAGTFDVLACAALETGLGGVDLDDLLVRQLGDELGPADRAMARARAAKEDLSLATQTALPSGTSLTRERFEELAEPVLAAAAALLPRTVRAAGLGSPDVTRVLLTGGTARIPLVHKLIREAVPVPVVEEADPLLGALTVARAPATRTPARAEPVDGRFTTGLPPRPPRPPVVITPLEPPRRRTARHAARSA